MHSKSLSLSVQIKCIHNRMFVPYTNGLVGLRLLPKSKQKGGEGTKTLVDGKTQTKPETTGKGSLKSGEYLDT